MASDTGSDGKLGSKAIRPPEILLLLSAAVNMKLREHIIGMMISGAVLAAQYVRPLLRFFE